MSWDDDDYGNEFAKFREASIMDYADADSNTFVLYCEILYETLKDYISRWNKKRKKVQVYNIILAFGTPYDSDTVDLNDGIYLDLGARLYKAIKQAQSEKWKYVKIIKITNPNDKFDVHYYVSEYKLKVQKAIDAPAKKKATAKAKK